MTLKPLSKAFLEGIETPTILKKLVIATRFLGKLQGLSTSIPDANMLHTTQGIATQSVTTNVIINTIALQEAKESNEIENIITTQSELYKASHSGQDKIDPAAKEVIDYAHALKQVFFKAHQSKLLRLSDILSIQEKLVHNSQGMRKTGGVYLVNDRTHEIVHTPPQDKASIDALMQNLMEFINDDSMLEADPLVKMAIIHHQFESIHPFCDGNGRIGRILNLIYLAMKDLLDWPVLYLSHYIVKNKASYYRELQAVRETGNWEPWILFMLDGVIDTSQKTIELILAIQASMQKTRDLLQAKLPKLYSQDLLASLYNHPYSTINSLMEDLAIARSTATRYLHALVDAGILQKQHHRAVYFINTDLNASHSHSHCLNERFCAPLKY